MHLVYVGDSKDQKKLCFSAIMIPATRWLEAFDKLVEMRRTMKQSHGIYTRTELHATDWLGGRGNVAPQIMRSRWLKAASSPWNSGAEKGRHFNNFVDATLIASSVVFAKYIIAFLLNSP